MALSFAEVLEASTERCRMMDAPLAERLQAFADDVRALNQDFAAIVDRMVGRLQKCGAGKSAPSVGQPMPGFLLPDESGRFRSLEEFLKQGPQWSSRSIAATGVHIAGSTPELWLRLAR